MIRAISISLAGVLWAGTALGQSALPVNAPTTLAAGAVAPVKARPVERAADVSFTGGLLRVSADNSSLNQILREIGRLTGMKITGGMADDRVFGVYGPAAASRVITELLDGERVNVMIVENSADGPAELILTPRTGGATPPNPNASVMAMQEDRRQDTGPPRGQFVPPQQFVPPPGQGGNNEPPPGAGSPVSGGNPVNTDNPPAATSSGTDGQPQSPNGVSTPQQIYEQLQRLRSQQQQTNTPQ